MMNPTRFLWRSTFTSMKAVERKRNLPSGVDRSNGHIGGQQHGTLLSISLPKGTYMRLHFPKWALERVIVGLEYKHLSSLVGRVKKDRYRCRDDTSC